MKHKLQNLLKHNWRTLLLLLTLITTSQGVWGGNNVIHGDFGEGWKDYDMGSGNSVTINVTSGEHQFGLKPGGSGWQANSGTMYRTNHTDWPFDNGNVNCKIDADIAGSYTFTYKYEDSKHKITVSYPWVIRGNFSGDWKNYNISNGTTATITDAVSSGTAREFKVFTDNVYSEDGGTMSRSDCTNWVLTTGENNSKVNIDVSGTYTFTWSNDNNHKLSVTYPAYTYKLRGSWDSWSGATDFTYVSSTSWTCTKSFSKTGVYNFNIRPASGSDYKGNGKYITRAHVSETLVPTSGDGNDVSITIDHTGSYSFNFNPSTGGLTVTYPTPSTPSALYIKGPLVYDSKWDPYTQDNVGYSHTAGTNTFVFSFNARTGGGGHSDNREFCISTTEGEDGKIQSYMDGTTSGWSFENGPGTNFVASSTIVSTDNTAIDITITYNNSTGQYHMVLAAACSGAPTINNGDIASKNWTKCGNENGRELSITASGGSGTLTYQWFRNSLASETGATAVTDMVEGGNTYSPSSTDYGTYYYYCVVRSGGACSSNKATSSFTGAITIKQTPTITPAAVTVKQYEPVKLNATNSSVNWSITAHPDGATADEYYLYDETKSTTMFKGKTGTGSYTITATSTGDGSCTATSSITVEEDDDEGC